MDTQDIFNKLARGTKWTLDKNVYSSNSKHTIKKQIHNITQNNDKLKSSNKKKSKSMNSFHDLLDRSVISNQILCNLKSCGYVTPTEIQREGIPAMLEDKQILACAPTGSGKTATFLIPLLMKLERPSKQGFRVLILCPTRELSTQILRETVLLANGTDIKAFCISKITSDEKKFGPNYSKKFDILITTPNRLIYLLRKENTVLSFNRLEWLVIDESDKLFETGVKSFKRQLKEIYKHCNDNVKKALFSATYSGKVSKWCQKNLKDYVFITIGKRNTTVSDVQQQLIYVGDDNGKLIAFRDLMGQGIALPLVIFVQTKERAKQLFNELVFDGINVDVIHADRTQAQRDNSVKSFREGKIWVLICTDLMGRGIDFRAVKLVINYDCPLSAISYIHRIGRTGRGGRLGKAITFFTSDDKPVLQKISQEVKASGGNVPDYLLSFDNKITSQKILRNK